MTRIDANKLHFKDLNDQIRAAKDAVVIDNCCGQRFLCSGQGGKKVVINGVPGNALGSYLNGTEIRVHCNAQDAVGDTMNDGMIVVDGSVGDALGYAMRGGKIYVQGSSGYRTGIHMKEYGDKKPVIIVGGSAGSFLGEYMAGGIVAVLGMDPQARGHIVGNFTGTGMHGGKIFLRCDRLPADLPAQVIAGDAGEEELGELRPYLVEYCGLFGLDMEAILAAHFYVLRPNAANPYKQLYTPN